MAKKANITKLKESMLVKQGSNKTVFPVSISDAIQVYKEGNVKHVSLTDVLNTKFGDGLVVRFSDNLLEDNYYYYLFTFRQGKNMEGEYGNSYKEKLLTALSCSNEDFIDLCVANGEEEENIEISHTPLTLESYKERALYSKYLNSLFLRAIPLHAGDIPSVIVKDSEGNEYKSGDTIYFTKYPGYLWICAENLDNEYISSAELEFTNNNNIHYIKVYSDEVDVPLVGLTYKNENQDYTNPLYLPNDIDASVTSSTNEIVNVLIDQGFPITIMPVDYPYNNASQVTEYCKLTKQGILIVGDVYKRGSSEKQNPIGLPLSYFNIIFSPEDGEGISPFVLDESKIMPVIIRKTSKWMGALKIKGNYATASIQINISDTGFVYKRENEEEFHEFPIEMSPEEVNTGAVFIIRPNDWKDIKEYVPFGVTQETQIVRKLSIVYNNDVDTTKNVDLICAIAEEDIPKEETNIIETHNTTSGNKYDTYCLIKAGDNCDSIKVSGIQVKSTTGELQYSLNYVVTGEAATIDEILQSEVTFESARLGTVIDTTENKYILFKIDINSASLTNPLGIVNGSLSILDSLDKLITVRFSNTIEDPTDIQNYPPSSYEAQINPTVIRSENTLDISKVTSRLSDETYATNEILAEDLKQYKILRNGIFSGLDTIVDASFVRYLENIQKIPTYAFYNCVALTTIILPDNITSIEDYAFKGCTNLENIVIPETVLSIGKGAFEGCTNLKRIVIPDSVTTLGSGIFAECPSLEYIDFGSNILSIENLGLEASDNLTQIVLRGIQEIINPQDIPTTIGVQLYEKMGLHIDNRITFSKAIQGENSSIVTFYVPQELTTLYPNTTWGTYFPNATFNSLNALYI